MSAPELLTGAEVLGPGYNHLSPREIAAAGFLARFRVKTTRDGYRLALRQWFEFADEHFIDVMTAKRREIEVWARYLEDVRGLAQSSIAGKLNGLAGFYRFAVADELIDKDPMAYVVRPKIQRESTTLGLSHAELGAIIATAKRSTAQDEALIMVLAFNGLRISEALSFDVERFDRFEGRPVIRVIRKGNKRDVIPFAHATWWAIQRCIDDRTEGPLFRSRTGKRLDQKGASRIVARIGKEAGLSKHVHPHMFRHAFVSVCRDRGVPDQDIIAATGHSDTRMVSYYDRHKDKIDRNPTDLVAATIGLTL